MSSTLGETVKLSVFGQSHSSAIGCVIDGLPAGFAIDFDQLNQHMQRRAPGQDSWSTPRKEADEPQILSGLNASGKTSGAPLALMIANTNTKSADYEGLRNHPRPGHADLAAHLRFGGHNDLAGGGHFSGRLTAPLVAAGGIALQMLAAQNIQVAAHIAQIGEATDTAFDPLDPLPQMEALATKHFRTIDDTAAAAMQEAISQAKAEADSVGGAIECACTGMPAGVGGPMFDTMEGLLARALFGIPAVKAVAFGEGTRAATLTGSANNDAYQLKDGRPYPLTNHAGGITGGLTTGAPLIFSVTFKPTPSIAAEQLTLNLKTGAREPLNIRGRHDPCIVPRAVPVVESVAAFVLLDALLTYGSKSVWPDALQNL